MVFCCPKLRYGAGPVPRACVLGFPAVSPPSSSLFVVDVCFCRIACLTARGAHAVSWSKDSRVASLPVLHALLRAPLLSTLPGGMRVKSKIEANMLWGSHGSGVSDFDIFLAQASGRLQTRHTRKWVRPQTLNPKPPHRSRQLTAAPLAVCSGPSSRSSLTQSLRSKNIGCHMCASTPTLVH